MKIIAAVFAVVVLMVGCVRGQGTSMPTAAVILLTPTEMIPSEPTLTPTETPRIAPQREKTDAVTNNLQDAYPPAPPEIIATPLPPDYPAPPLIVDTITPAPTPTSLSLIEAAQQAWDECKNRDIPPEIAGFQDPRLAGLVFRYWNWLWQIDTDGRPTVLSCLALSNFSPSGRWMTFSLNQRVWVVDRETNVVRGISSSPERFSASGSWSPDERYYFYSETVNEAEPMDNWVWDSSTGHSRQITHTPDISEYGICVWPAYPNWLLFFSRTRELENEPETIGYLSIIRMDGSGEQRLTKSIYPRFDFSPDGKTLVYDDYGGDWLLKPDSAPAPFLPEQFVIEGWNITNLGLPDWSPDGTKIAWWASGEDETGQYSGVAVFDLEKKKAWFVHPFVHMGIGGSPSFFEWDPSSTWLSMYVRDQDVSRDGFWIARYDDSEAYHNGNLTSEIIWTPVGDQFLYKDTSATKIYLKQVGSWASQVVSLPYETIPLYWQTVKTP